MISKGNKTPPRIIMGVRNLDEADSPTTNMLPLSLDFLAEQSVGSKLKSPILSKKKSWLAYNKTGSPEVTVNNGRKNLQTYCSISPCAWTTKYNSSMTTGQPHNDDRSN
jgi:hypothetical protein